MTGFGKLAVILTGAIFILSAARLAAQEPANIAGDTRLVSSAPPAPRTPADMPPNPPKVTCDGGQLTISALNSTLGAVLNAVRNCTGAEIDVPESARGERLFAELGPGPVRTVLADFLSSTDFNYVIKASPSDPQKIQMVLLNPRASDSTTEIATVTNGTGDVSANRRAWLDARHNYEQSIAPPDDVPTQQAETTPSAAAPVEPVAASANPVSVEAEQVNAVPTASVAEQPAAGEVAPAPGESSAAQSGGKTTQEMIGDMRRLFEQRKQMVQQQPATAK